MDRYTIQLTLQLIEKDINKTFCMCFWGKTKDKLKELGISKINIKNVITPYNYKLDNTYLGFDMNILCSTISTTKYNNYGVLWGKDIDCINLSLVKYLTEKGLILYSVSKTPLNINNVIDLGILPKDQWYQLLNDCKFFLGSGKPKSGISILDALFYKTPIIGPKHQFPESVLNKNIHFLDNLSNNEILSLLNNINFEDDKVVDDLISSDNFHKRVKELFQL